MWYIFKTFEEPPKSIKLLRIMVPKFRAVTSSPKCTRKKLAR